ncbi:hypothetical protein B0O99DRAFT_643118 [Bisporella sp. PMI_857]|nr:hypothetical protein B0O99DRAFT_643118 [Bisporella sp. PMI_857]
MPIASRVPSRLNARQSGPRRQSRPNVDLERKRKTDRESQRAVRERTKNYISHLENLVDTLQKNQHDQRLQNMTVQYTQLHEENEKLRNVVTSISRMIRGVELLDSAKYSTKLNPAMSAESMPSQKHHPAFVVNSHDLLPILPCQNVQWQPHSPCIVRQQTVALNTFTPYAGPSCSKSRSPIQASETSTFDFEACLPDSSITSAVNDPDTSKGTSSYADENVHIVAVVNNALSKAESLTISSLDIGQDADIAIRAIAYGWPASEQQHTLDPAWQIIRQIDEGIFFSSRPVERLAIVRVLRLKLIQQATTSDEEQVQALLPQYMQSRPLQNLTAHPSIIDYFVWPELREYLILHAQKELSNQVAAAFASSLRFLWPFDLCDAWTRNRQTNLYSFSRLFDERFSDVKNWALTSDFFDSYPELIGCVPSCDPPIEEPPSEI